MHSQFLSLCFPLPLGRSVSFIHSLESISQILLFLWRHITLVLGLISCLGWKTKSDFQKSPLRKTSWTVFFGVFKQENPQWNINKTFTLVHENFLCLFMHILSNLTWKKIIGKISRWGIPQKFQRLLFSLYDSLFCHDVCCSTLPHGFLTPPPTSCTHTQESTHTETTFPLCSLLFRSALREWFQKLERLHNLGSHSSTISLSEVRVGLQTERWQSVLGFKRLSDNTLGQSCHYKVTESKVTLLTKDLSKIKVTFIFLCIIKMM